jgi:hypothetical protein
MQDDPPSRLVLTLQCSDRRPCGWRPTPRVRHGLGRLGPVAGGPDSNVLIEILDRLAAHAETPAPTARWCICRDLHRRPRSDAEHRVLCDTFASSRAAIKAPLCAGASEVVAARRLPCPHRLTFGRVDHDAATNLWIDAVASYS